MPNKSSIQLLKEYRDFISEVQPWITPNNNARLLFIGAANPLMIKGESSERKKEYICNPEERQRLISCLEEYKIIIHSTDQSCLTWTFGNVSNFIEKDKLKGQLNDAIRREEISEAKLDGDITKLIQRYIDGIPGEYSRPQCRRRIAVQKIFSTSQNCCV